jgi:ribosomal protein S18 acetylase RimI-like enzyme
MHDEGPDDAPPFEIRGLGRGDERAVHDARELFDDAPGPTATARFLDEDNHHLLIAYDAANRPVGFVSGVETTHPDKGTEMFLYELGVADHARRRGIGSALVEALAGLARDRGCYGMWTGTEQDNAAARATYRRAGASTNPPHVFVDWDFSPAPGPPDPGTGRERR